MKHVLFICSQPFFQWRGSPIRIGYDLLALGLVGYATNLLTLPIGKDRAIPGTTTIRVANLFAAKRIPIGPSLLKAGFDLIIFFKALQLVLTRRYDVIHCVEDTGPIGVVIARIAKAKLIFEKHSDPSSYRQKGGLRNLIMWCYAKAERFSMRAADAIICTGEGLVNQARAVCPHKPVYHIFDIPSSLEHAEPGRTAAVRATLKQADDDILATYVGSFAVYQGIDLLFQAIPLVVRRNPKVRIVIIGGQPDEIRERKAWLEREGVAGAVVWAGWVAPEALNDYLAASDILLSPRLSGVNTPLKLLDYLKAERGIVATDTPANRLILDDTMALLVPPDAQAFADGICRLADDPKLRSALADNGQRLIRDTYNFEEFRRRLDDAYRSVLR